jgi:hypothetical protein
LQLAAHFHHTSQGVQDKLVAAMPLKLRQVPSVYSEEEVRRYLAHIGFPGLSGDGSAAASGAAALPPPTLRTLALLQLHHLTTMPFENTSLHYEHEHQVRIEPHHCLERFVARNAGGYCMQQNLVLLNVLRFLGFRWCAALVQAALLHANLCCLQLLLGRTRA